MNKIYMLFVVLFLLGCSTTPTVKINDLTQSVEKCVVTNDKIQCVMNGEIYVIYRYKVDQITTWDKSAWKENENKTTNKTIV